MLVVLRLSLGCHFLYEGVWKIENAKEFSAEPFLTQAKGPAAKFFYSMLPDLDGRQRLRIDTDIAGKKEIRGELVLKTWADLRDRVVRRYGMTEEQAQKAKEEYERYEDVLRAWFKEHLVEIDGYFGSLARFEEERQMGNNGNRSQESRNWDRQNDLRKEVKGWLVEIDKIGVDFQRSLWDLLDDKQKGMGWLMESRNPLHWSRIEQINFAVTYGLTAIGLCLMLGFCTRLACLGGAAFMIFVNLTQPGWPTIYPPAPPVVGHALLVNKDFLELIALLTLATTCVGRWGGLDYFLHHWFGRKLDDYFAERV